MFNYKKLIKLKLTFLFIFFSNVVLADNHNLNEVLELIQKDLKTLEKAVYSGSINTENSNSQKSFDGNSEDVLTRHLLKLSEVESQFRELTNKFEEINFKIDKLSSRLSKVQADNQLRFQDIENSLSSGEVSQKSTSKLKKKLPGSSQPQDLGSISYKDTETNETTQKIQSVETTSSVVAEVFETEQKLLPDALAARKKEGSNKAKNSPKDTGYWERDLGPGLSVRVYKSDGRVELDGSALTPDLRARLLHWLEKRI